MTRTGIGNIMTHDQDEIKHLGFRDLSLGHRVGFYQVKGNIGKGNFSSVKMAIHSLTKGSFVNVCHLSSFDKIGIMTFLSYHIAQEFPGF